MLVKDCFHPTLKLQTAEKGEEITPRLQINSFSQTHPGQGSSLPEEGVVVPQIAMLGRLTAMDGS